MRRFRNTSRSPQGRSSARPRRHTRPPLRRGRKCQRRRSPCRSCRKLASPHHCRPSLGRNQTRNSRNTSAQAQGNRSPRCQAHRAPRLRTLPTPRQRCTHASRRDRTPEKRRSRRCRRSSSKRRQRSRCVRPRFHMLLRFPRCSRNPHRSAGPGRRPAHCRTRSGWALPAARTRR